MLNKIFIVASIVAIIPWLQGCPCDCAPTPYEQRIVQGTVTDSVTGLPIANATVATSNSDYVLTDTDGWYSVPRPTNLTVLKSGYYADLTESTQFPDVTTYTYDISLIPGDAADSTPPATPLPHWINRDHSNSVIGWQLTENEPPDFAGFVVYKGNEPMRLTLYSYLSTYEVSDPADCYSVAAIDATGNESARSAEMCAVLTGCSAVEFDRIDPSLSIVSANEIKIEWGVPTSKPKEQYTIYRDGVLLATLGTGENLLDSSTRDFNYYAYSDTDLLPISKYCYSVVAGNETQECGPLCISTWP